jgi:inner membrane protein
MKALFIRHAHSRRTIRSSQSKENTMPRAFVSSTTFKVFVLLFLTLLLLIPLAQIGALIEERGQSRQEAAAELARTYAGPQTLAGPVLVVPYTEHWTTEERDAKGGVRRTPHSRTQSHFVFPEILDIAGAMDPQERYRGIFSILFYTFKAKADGRFPGFRPSDLVRREKNSSIEIGTPLVAVGLGDVRGMEGTPALGLASHPLPFRQQVPGVADELGRGIHAPLEGAALAAFRREEAMPFSLQISLVGQERLSIVPLAGETTARITSPWAHPSFGGNFLASERSVADSGFDAKWRISSLVTLAQAQLVQNKGEGKARHALETVESFNVALIQPLNVYSMTDRAVKYGALFVGLTLMAVFLFELFKQLRLHPVQYGLVGFSIALFFLLLLALSEKLPFAPAYACAAGGSVALLAVYFSAVLRGARRGLSLAGFVAVLYAALYGLLASEDNALLLGSLLLFGMLAVLMLATRKVDWYGFGPKPQPS